MGVIDFNGKIRCDSVVCSTIFGVEHARRTAGFFTGHQSLANTQLPQMCSTPSRRTVCEAIPEPRSVPGHGICSAYPSRESSGYRSLSSRSEQKAPPYGNSGSDIPEHTGRCQRTTRLENPRRLCPITDQDCTPSPCGRGSGTRSRQYRSRSRRIHDRSLPLRFLLGAVPLHQVSGQTPYAAGFARKYSDLHPYLGRQAARCQCS